MESFDILIINQGVSGLALACELSSRFRIVIIENHLSDFDILQVNKWDIKTSLINIIGMKIFQHLKIWDENIALFSNLYNKLEIYKDSNKKK